jgi:hypothetical protein
VRVREDKVRIYKDNKLHACDGFEVQILNR